MSLETGDRLGRYEILGPIGAGGMGEVYRARDSELDRDVAIKVLPESVSQDPDRLARFECEAKAVARLSHPNILEIFDFGRDGEVTYAVTELLEGETVRERIDAGGLGWRQATEIGAAIADGLSAAHQAGIVHRDLKPSNVFLTADGRVKVLDFGLARSLELEPADQSHSPTQSHYTEPGSVLGTVGYMSPEQVRGRTVDHRSDVFALGCVLYEMASGRGPFHRNQTAECMAAILRDDPPSLTGFEIPEAFPKLLLRCLQKTPGERFQTAAEVAVALRTLADTISGLASAAPSEEAVSIVVLPFEDMSPDRDNEYFSDGLSEEIIADLSRIGSLRVISRTSAFAFKGTGKPIPAVASELGVRYVLEGSVRKAGDRLRITAQLIDAGTDAHMWAEKYSGSMEDIFDIQESVSRSIVDALELKLTPTEAQKIAERPIHDPRAYDAYLKAKTLIQTATEDGINQALRLLDHAVEAVGDNPQLYSQMSHGCFQLANIGAGGADHLERAERYARKALDLDSGSHEALADLGWIQILGQGDVKRAIGYFRKALEINPNDPMVLVGMATCLQMAGRTRDSIPYCERCLQVGPTEIYTQYAQGAVYFYEADYARALEAWESFPEMHPGSPHAHYYYAQMLAFNGRFDEAQPIIDRLATAHPDHIMSQLGVILKHSFQGDKEKALQGLTDDFKETVQRDAELSKNLAQLFAILGDKDESLNWLENAVDLGLVNYPLLAEKDPFLESLRGEKRFKKLMVRVKHEWESFEV